MLAATVAPPIGLGDIQFVNAALAFQRERLRAMSADDKVRVAQALWRDAWNATTAGVRAQHEDWSGEQVAERVRELMRDAGP